MDETPCRKSIPESQHCDRAALPLIAAKNEKG
jgi:hypothetical protein